MFQPWPSLDYSRRSGFSYERWLEERSHADVIVKALDRSMIDGSERMGDLLKSIDSIAGDQRASFEHISNDLVGINETLEWGFVELSAGLDRVEQATYAVRDSVEKVDKSVNILISTVNQGFKSVNAGLDIANSHLAKIEDAVLDVDQAWALANYRRAAKAIELGYMEDAVELLESTINGQSGRPPYNLDYRFYLLLGSCYFGGAPHVGTFKPDMQRASSAFSKSLQYIRMCDKIDQSSLKECLNGAAWTNYCINELDRAEDYYAKSLGIYPEYTSEFGLTKTILSKNDIDRGSVLINYLILKYGNRALIHMASDPDFIHYRKYVLSAKQELKSKFKANFNEVISEIEINISELQSSINLFRGARRSFIINRASKISDMVSDIKELNNIAEMPVIEDDVDLSPFFKIHQISKPFGSELYSEKSRIVNAISEKKFSVADLNSPDFGANPRSHSLIQSLLDIFSNRPLKDGSAAKNQRIENALDDAQFDRPDSESELKYLNEVNRMIEIHELLIASINKVLTTYKSKKYNIQAHNDIISDVLYKFPRQF